MLPAPPSIFQIRAPVAPDFANSLQQIDDAAISNIIEQADQHAASAVAAGLALGLDVLGDIALPPGAETQADRAQMRALAALYLAADLEPAGLISSVETLAGLAASGVLRVELDDALPLVHHFWRERNQRIAANERLAFFGRLFGAAYGAQTANVHTNDYFEALMLNFCEALYHFDGSRHYGAQGGMALQVQLLNHPRHLISNLVEAGGVITACMATEVLKTQKASLEILKRPRINAAFMARETTGVVAGVAKMSVPCPSV